MSTLATNAITDASGGNTATINSYTPTESNMAGRNRIINGDMRIDQRNAGASVTPASGAYTVDRFRVSIPGGYTGLTFQQVADAPSGFINSLSCTISTAVTPSSSDGYSFLQAIEGLNLYDLGLGTASAKPFVISFWVKSSVTGTFCVAVRSSGGAQTFIADYVVASANTWEYKTVSISAPTSGSFATDNTTALFVNFSLGAGSSFISTANTWLTGPFTQTSGATNIVSTLNATIQFTGVQLEVGTVATPFEHRQYGQELALCQRYYEVLYSDAFNQPIASSMYAAGVNFWWWHFKQEKRAQATVTKVNGTWNVTTPAIYGGVSNAQLYTSGTFYLYLTAGQVALSASSEL